MTDTLTIRRKTSALKAENKRLRDALKVIAGYPQMFSRGLTGEERQDCRDIARKALAEESK